MKKINMAGAMLIALLSLSGTLKAQEQQAAKSVPTPEAQAKADAEVDKKATDWVASLSLTDTAKATRVKNVIATHLKAIRDWNNNHSYESVPAGIDPATGKALSTMDRQIIINSSLPKSVHENLMTGLRKDLTNEQVETVLDKYTIGKVAFTLAGYKSIIPDLTPVEEAAILANLKLAREQAIDFKNIKQVSAIFEIYKTKNEQYLNSNGRNWHKLYGDYTKAIIAKKAADKAAKDKAATQNNITMSKRILLTGVVACLLITNVFAQNPWRKGIIKDEFIYDKAPYPECHAATIAETPTGLVASWFGGTKERNPDVCIWVSRFVNGKWTEGINVANGIQNDTLRYACWNPVLYQVPKGELQLYYKIGPSPAKWKGFVKTSKDGGISWSEQKALPEGFLGPIKNKPVLLKDGTLLSPVSTEGKAWQVHFEATKDFGKNWTMIGPISDGKDMKAIQPSILTYRDDRLQALCRSQNRAILSTWSKDGGQTWSALEKTSLPNNNSGTDAVTLKDGRQLLVYNHVLPLGNLAKGARTPLNVAVSKDGITWYAALILEDSPISQYSYPSVIQSADGLVHVVYTWRRQKIKHVVIDPSKLELKEIKDGVWPKVEGYTPPMPTGETKDL